MKLHNNPHRLWPVLLMLTFGWVMSAVSAYAQSTGTIQGRVFNPATQEYVRNAEVRLEGTNRVEVTGSDGSFQFNNVPAGSAAVTVTYTGYNTAREMFSVTAGQPTVREIALTSTSVGAAQPGDVIQLQAFKVSTEREGNAKAIMGQRNNMT